jgi:hypothetical protein
MKFFQASMYLNVLLNYNTLFPDDRLNVLLSIAHNEGERKEFVFTYRNMINELICDSGAWSVYQGNSDLTLSAVITFLQRYGDCFDRYYSFDTDFSNRGFSNNITNHRAMEKAGLKTVPVIHNFCTDEIEFYVKSGKHYCHSER